VGGLTEHFANRADLVQGLQGKGCIFPEHRHGVPPSDTQQESRILALSRAICRAKLPATVRGHSTVQTRGGASVTRIPSLRLRSPRNPPSPRKGGEGGGVRGPCTSIRGGTPPGTSNRDSGNTVEEQPRV